MDERTKEEESMIGFYDSAPASIADCLRKKTESGDRMVSRLFLNLEKISDAGFHFCDDWRDPFNMLQAYYSYKAQGLLFSSFLHQDGISFPVPEIEGGPLLPDDISSILSGTSRRYMDLCLHLYTALSRFDPSVLRKMGYTLVLPAEGPDDPVSFCASFLVRIPPFPVVDTGWKDGSSCICILHELLKKSCATGVCRDIPADLTLIRIRRDEPVFCLYYTFYVLYRLKLLVERKG